MSLPDFSRIKTIPHILMYQAETFPDRLAYIYLVNPPALNGPSVTFKELVTKVSCFAQLISEQSKVGDRVLLIFENDLQYIISFYACLWAGVIAVPVYPPVSKSHEDRLRSIIQDCTPTLVLTSTTLAPICPKDVNHLIYRESALPFATDRREWKETDIAFLQYTSGSTGDPKGVVLNHYNILSSVEMMVDGYGLNSNDIQVSWLPMYHDMGLIGGIIAAMNCGITTYVMSPMNVVRPLRWLQTISKVKATINATPNFALDLAVKRLDEEKARGLDLSSLEKIICAGEPNRTSTLESFSSAFAKYGLNSKCLLPAWGLAEGTLMLTHEKLHHGFRSVSMLGHQYVSCGQPAKNVELKICSESGNLLPESTIGEVWVSAPSVAEGYWNKSRPPIETKIFGDSKRSFLRTGDMGFVDKGQLFVTGRKKEMIKFRGQNLFPSDLENVAHGASSFFEKSIMVAFAHDTGETEKIVMAVEIPHGANDSEVAVQIQKIKNEIFEKLDIPLEKILCLRKGQIPRTTSGKIKRVFCQTLYETNGFEIFKDDWKNTDWYLTAFKNFTKLKILWKLKTGL